jgi:DNA-binding MarR family transcriptional regulator
MVKWDKVIDNLSPSTSQFKVLVHLSFKGCSQPSDVSTETGIRAGTVRPALRALLDKGYVEQGDDRSYCSLVPFTEIVSHLYSLAKK